ncbi:MAG: serine/threonine-protein kinase [Rhodococcus fascians]
MPAESTAAPAAIADYRIVRLLAEGNHGKFYLAEAPERLGLTEKLVALKVFHNEVTEDAYRRGVRELRAFAAVKSPRLVKIFDAVLDDRFFYAMEYFPLGSLASPGRELTRAETLRALQDAAVAVHELHENGMVHGDVQPANIMFDGTGGKLSDLGLVRVLNSESTVTSIAPTTSVEFIDPELLQGALPSRATDIWALGATIHRVLTGDGLYGDLPPGQPLVAIRAVVSGQSKVSSKLGVDEARLVQACLAPAEHRPPTAAAVAEAIGRLA